MISPYVFAGLTKPKEEIHSDIIMIKVCNHFNITVEQLCSKSRERRFVDARAYYCHIQSVFAKVLLRRIADSICRDHSSVIHLRDKFIDELSVYKDVKEDYRKFVEKINYQWSLKIV